MTQGPYSSELICLSAMRGARAAFFDAIVDHAEAWRAENGGPELAQDERKLLRSDGLAQLAEFFYALREAKLSDPEQIKGFMRRHNDDMRALLESCERGYTRFGLSAARIKSAFFTPQQMDLVAHESANGRVTFDQRSIGKIMVQIMSFESCRTLLVLLASCGLLTRSDFRSIVLISSGGQLEDLYGAQMRAIVESVRAV
jgi:hypothetical protein